MITTTANRVKRGIYWCEEADEITASALNGSQYTWDDEIPIEWILEHGGLANTLLSLGAVRPRFQKYADIILRDYLRLLYKHVRKHMIEVGLLTPDDINVPHWIGNPDRSQASKLECGKWMHKKVEQAMPSDIKLCETMALLFSAQPMVLKAIHATKLYLGAYAIKHGFKNTDIEKQELRTFVKTELEKHQ